MKAKTGRHRAESTVNPDVSDAEVRRMSDAVIRMAGRPRASAQERDLATQSEKLLGDEILTLVRSSPDPQRSEVLELIRMIKRHLVVLHEEVQAIYKHLGVQSEPLTLAEAKELVAASRLIAATQATSPRR